MQKLIQLIQKKVNGMILSLMIAGVIMLMLAVLIVWSQLILQLAVGMFIVVIAYMFFFAAYKIWALKKEIEKHLKIK
jgi:type IV secretory pathway VirB3-like protein